ncbi:hypothetical protein AAY473_024281 [Plecturocebus cupreus]
MITAHCTLHLPGSKLERSAVGPDEEEQLTLEGPEGAIILLSVLFFGPIIGLYSLQRWGFTILIRLVLNSRPCDLPTSASQSTGITGMSHHARP